MDKRMLREILAAHADQIVKGKATGKDYLELLPGQDEELAPLLNVAEQVQSTLRPITPANHFERNLKQDLLATAQYRQTTGYRPPNPARELFIVLATLAFILSLTAVLVTLKRRGGAVGVRNDVQII